MPYSVLHLTAPLILHSISSDNTLPDKPCLIFKHGKQGPIFLVGLLEGAIHTLLDKSLDLFKFTVPRDKAVVPFVQGQPEKL
jgi:hypothetical protein